LSYDEINQISVTVIVIIATKKCQKPGLFLIYSNPDG